MSSPRWKPIMIVTGVALLVASADALAESSAWEQRPASERALYTAAAVIANVVPITSALVAPRCLPGYLLCKLSFAGLSVVAAAESLVMSGGADQEQPRAILQRGFTGDWFLTGRHVAGDAQAEPYPEAPPPSGGDAGSGFTPPPI